MVPEFSVDNVGESTILIPKRNSIFLLIRFYNLYMKFYFLNNDSFRDTPNVEPYSMK